MSVKEILIGLVEKKQVDAEIKKAALPTLVRFVVLEDGRLVPVEPGGMVEVALHELGGRIVKVSPAEEG